MTAMSLTDRYGLPVTAASRAAVDACDRGVRALLGVGADTAGAFQEALGHEPDFALAGAGLAVFLYRDEKIAQGRARVLLDRRLAVGPNPGHYWTTQQPLSSAEGTCA
jgi:hypothetical protein